ncbi:hypothetical protein G6N82_11275 [Altererythrobacter sp. BO-6]|nr:hypothetical protein [Altererythrobacter sp. BO-6]QIG52757.1 hypothetical protein G6N82_11275 [Altererythrobacter sp. BO-6]
MLRQFLLRHAVQLAAGIEQHRAGRSRSFVQHQDKFTHVFLRAIALLLER